MSNNNLEVNHSLIESKKWLQQLNWRYAVKKFDSTKKIPNDLWQDLEKSLILSPSSYGLQVWKFFIVQNPEIRKKLTVASWNQTQVSDCSHFVVFAFRNKMDEKYIDKYLNDISKKRGVSIENLAVFKGNLLGDLVNGPRSQQIQTWASRQCYIALGQFMASCALLGVDACPMEGLNPQAYDEILGLNGTDYSTVVACAAGYRHSEDAYSKNLKVRFDRDEVVKYI